MSEDKPAWPDKAKRLDELRQRIDDLDEELLNILNRRAEVSLEVGRLKADSKEPIFKPLREKYVITRLQVLNPGPLPERHLYSIYKEIMSSSRRLQRPEKVVYLGPEGTFSYFAGIEFMGHSAELTPKPQIEDLFRAVSDGEAELGIVPLENSLHGTVGQAADLFLRYPVHVQAEVYLRITHCLMSQSDRLSDIKRVYSHSQPLGQCAEWLRSNLPHAETLPMASTAASARLCADEPDAAVVGHSRLAQMFGLHVLAEHVEDLPDNWTRFLVIATQPCTEQGRDKTSILFTTADRPGALAYVLNLFADKGVNMNKLESRPLRGQKWKYVFFADLECDLTLPEYAPLLKELRDHCQILRVLGAYPAGPHLEGLS